MNDGGGWNSIIGATANTYTPASNTVGTFQYFCVVSQDPTSIDCSVNTDTCTLTVNPAPDVNTPPQNDSLCVGGVIADLYVIPNGPGNITYEWYLVSSPNDILVDTSATYTPPTNTAGVFEYYCVVSFSSGGCSEVNSSNITIVINPDPTIDIQPLATDTICLGGTINNPLSVSYTQGTGVGNVTYQWYDATGPVTGANNSTFTPTTNNLNIGSYYYYAIVSFDGNDCDDAVSDSAHIEIIDIAQPSLELWSGQSQDTLCINHTQNPVWINTSTGVNINSYNWQIINNITGSIVFDTTQGTYTSPSFPFLSSGTVLDGYVDYSLIVSVENDCGIPSDTQTLVIKPLPNPDFDMYISTLDSITGDTLYLETDVVCLGSPITISYGNTPPPFPFAANDLYNDSININWGDGSSIWYSGSSDCGNINGSSLICFENASHTYLNTGIYPICVTAFNECDTIVLCDTIEVINNYIQSSVQNSITYICQGDSIYFTDNSTFTAPNQTEISWWWNIDPNNINDYLLPFGQLSNTPNLTYNQSTVSPGYSIGHAYNTPGIKYVLQQISTNNVPPCVSEYDYTLLNSFIVYPQPIAYFTNPINDLACFGDSVNFGYNSEIPIVSGIPTGDQLIDSVIWSVTSPSGGTTIYNLSPGDDLQILANEVGTWIIQIEISTNKGCSKIYSDDIIVHSLPIADFTITPDSSCVGNGLTCFDADSSINGTGGSIIDYFWDFPSPPANISNSSSNPVCVHFSNNGNWFVDLIVIDQVGCRDTIRDTVIISDSMTAYFEATTACFGDSTQFTSAYPFSSSNANNWSWDFGDGVGTSNLQNPEYTYSAPGDYPVTLIVWDSTYALGACIDTIIDTVHVNQLPIPLFTADTACFGDSTQFTDGSIIGEPGSSLSPLRSWYFDTDNLVDATSLNPQNVFDTCGLNILNIVMGVSDDNNCYNEVTQSITISCPPDAAFTIGDACIGDFTYFESISNAGTFNIVDYSWYNASSGTYSPSLDSTLNYATYIFDNIGNQDSTMLLISDPLGCKDSIVNYAYVRDIPNANFYTTETNYCKGQEIHFFENSFTTGIIQTTNWTFGGLATPNISNDPNPIITFPSYGDWPITLTVTDDYGCADDTSYMIEIDNLPNVNFSWDSLPGQACVNDSICFYNQSTQSINGNPLMTWLWDFGDGLPSSSLTPCHLFDSINEFQGECILVDLTVTDSLGCSNSTTNLVTIHPIPYIENFYVEDGICEGDCFTLQEFNQFNIDNCIDDEISSLIWVFNTDTISTFDSLQYCPPANLSTDSSHFIKLIVETDWGCTNEHTKVVEYWKRPEINITSILYPDGKCGDKLPFRFESTPAYFDALAVLFTDPINTANNVLFDNPNFNHITPNPGVFNLNIYLENTINSQQKCSLSKDTIITAYPLPKASFTPFDYSFCYQEDTLINFFDSSYIINEGIFEQYTPNTTEITSWIWEINSPDPNSNPIIKTTQNISHEFAALNDSATIYSVELDVVTNYGCSQDTSTTLRVLPTPIADFYHPRQDLPNYGTYILNGSNSTNSIGNYANPLYYSYNWQITDGPENIVNILNTQGDNGIKYFPDADSLYYQFSYFLYGQNDSTEICLEVQDRLYGCKDTYCKNVKVEAWGELFVPNALYPESGDIGSSVFLPKGKSLTEYNLQIFDKFGNLLWENDEIDELDGSPKVGWDGTSNGNLLPKGTYVWKIYAKFINGPWNGVDGNNKKTGTVYLIR